ANDTVQTNLYSHPSVYKSMTYVFPVRIGKFWNSEGFGSLNRVVQNYEVIVPLGHLTNAFRVEKQWLSFNDSYRVTSWLVPGIGIVKKTTIDYRLHAITWALIEFHAPPN